MHRRFPSLSVTVCSVSVILTGKMREVVHRRFPSLSVIFRRRQLLFIVFHNCVICCIILKCMNANSQHVRNPTASYLGCMCAYTNLCYVLELVTLYKTCCNADFVNGGLNPFGLDPPLRTPDIYIYIYIYIYGVEAVCLWVSGRAGPRTAR